MRHHCKGLMLQALFPTTNRTPSTTFHDGMLSLTWPLPRLPAYESLTFLGITNRIYTKLLPSNRVAPNSHPLASIKLQIHVNGAIGTDDQ